MDVISLVNEVMTHVGKSLLIGISSMLGRTVTNGLGVAGIVISVVLMAVYMYVMLFGETRFHRDGIVGKIHTFLTRGNALSRLKRMLPSFVVRAFDATVGKLVFQQHRFFLFFFIALAVGSYASFFYLSMGRLPNRYLSGVHRYGAIFALAFTLYMYVKAVRANPGVITEKNVREYYAIYPFDGLMFVKKWCSTCRIWRPARSKHSRVTNRCVARFDHFCIWLNNDVGHGNHIYFVGFLITITANLFYASWGCIWTILAMMDDLDLRGKYPMADIVRYLFAHEGPAMSLSLFAVSMSFVMLSFTMTSLYQIARGLTTNEAFKVNDLANCKIGCIRILGRIAELEGNPIEDHDLIALFGPEGHEALRHSMFVESKETVDIYGEEILDTRTEEEKQRTEVEEMSREEKNQLLVNHLHMWANGDPGKPYRKGIFQNLKDILYRPSVVFKPY